MVILSHNITEPLPAFTSVHKFFSLSSSLLLLRMYYLLSDLETLNLLSSKNKTGPVWKVFCPYFLAKCCLFFRITLLTKGFLLAALPLTLCFRKIILIVSGLTFLPKYFSTPIASFEELRWGFYFFWHINPNVPLNPWKLSRTWFRLIFIICSVFVKWC